MRGRRNAALYSLALVLAGACGESPRGDQTFAVEPAGSDASPGTEEADPTQQTIGCGLLDFEDVLGTIDARNPEASAPSPLTIAGTTFTAAGGEKVFNHSATLYGQPFTSDYFGVFAYNEGATIEFPYPVKHLSFDHAQRAVTFDASFELRAGDTVLTTFTTSDEVVGTVRVDVDPPVTAFKIVWVGNGSSSLLNLDNLDHHSASRCDGSDA